MENKESEAKNELFMLKIKKYQKKIPFHRRDINSSILKDYDKISNEIKDEIKNREGEKALNGGFPVLVISHPEIKDIFIYSKEQWDLYYYYNIIEKCKSKNSLRIEYYFYNKLAKEEKIIEKIKECKKSIIKHIIKIIPCGILFNILIEFLEKNTNFAEQFKEYMIIDLINNYKKNEEDSNDDINENININKIINYDNEKDVNKYIDHKKLEKIYKGHYIDNNEFINLLNNKFNKISKLYEFKKSFNDIKNILNEDEEKNKKNLKKNEKDIEKDKHIFHTNVDLKYGKSLENIINDNSSVNIVDDQVLQSVLNPPSKYISNLMENGNFFKKFNKEEYYRGFEDYKDTLNRESYLMLNKSN